MKAETVLVNIARGEIGVKLFCDNLTRYLEGRPLENVIDWSRGY